MRAPLAPRIGLAIVLALCAAKRNALAQQGRIHLTVVDSIRQQPLPYSGVSIAGGAEDLTDASGQVTMQAGGSMVKILVRHIGFRPRDVDVTLGPAAPVDVRIALVPIPALLRAVRSQEASACTSPGRPGVTDSVLALVFQQLETNAQQYRTFRRAYPYVMRIGRTYRTVVVHDREFTASPAALSDTSTSVTRTDTIILRSDVEDAAYEPGRIVGPQRTATGQLVDAVRIPTLSVLADPRFQRTHCFRTDGVVVAAGQTVLAIDFRASADLRDADLDGVFFLDPQTFMVDSSEVWLSRSSPYAASFDSVTVRTRFQELRPGIPIVQAIHGRNRFTAEAGRRSGDRDLPKGLHLLADLEDQDVLQIQFIRARP